MGNKKTYPRVDPPEITETKTPAIPPLDESKFPKKSGAMEFSPEFRKGMVDAWRKAAAGQTRQEAEFSTAVNREGRPINRPITVTDDNQSEGVGRVNASVMPNDKLVFHTHSKFRDAKPSSTDIDSAKKSGRPILTGSRDGLFETDSTGKTEQLSRGLDWTDEKKPLEGEKEDTPHEFSRTPYSLASDARKGSGQ